MLLFVSPYRRSFVFIDDPLILFV